MKIPISFKRNEIELYEWVMSKRNYSAYIKDLIDADMNGTTAIKKEIKKAPEPIEEKKTNESDILSILNNGIL